MNTILRRAIQVAVPGVVLLIAIAVLNGSRADWSRDYVVSGLAFAIAGLIAWSLRPANRFGILMMTMGGALVLSTVLAELSGRTSEFRIHVVFGWLGTLWEVLLIHLLVAFPEGRLTSNTSRTLVGSVYFFFAVSLFATPYLFAAAVYPFFLFLAAVLILRRWWLGGRARRR